MVSMEIIELLIIRFNTLYDELGFDNQSVIILGASLIEECIRQDKDITISKTTDNEILIYTDHDGSFDNLIIDHDGDIEYICIPKNRTMVYNEYFRNDGGIDIEELVSMI